MHRPCIGYAASRRHIWHRDNICANIADDVLRAQGRYGATLALRDQYAGVGGSFQPGPNGVGIFVKTVHPGGPLALSGKVKSGDELIAVNGEHVSGMSPKQFAGTLIGPIGTSVTGLPFELGVLSYVRRQLSVLTRGAWAVTLRRVDGSVAESSTYDVTLIRSAARSVE